MKLSSIRAFLSEAKQDPALVVFAYFWISGCLANLVLAGLFLRWVIDHVRIV
jgi:hypothetical protein